MCFAYATNLVIIVIILVQIGQLQTGHLNRLHQQDLEHQKVIMKEVGKYQMLQEEAEKAQHNYKNSVRERELRHHEDMVQLREQFEDSLRNQRAQCNRVSEDKVTMSCKMF